MTETISRPQRSGAVAERDPDHERWARYWQEMRQHSLTLIEQAFDEVARAFDAGEAGGAVDVVMFCADESQSAMGIVTALHNLLAATFRERQVASEYRAGVAIDDLVTM